MSSTRIAQIISAIFFLSQTGISTISFIYTLHSWADILLDGAFGQNQRPIFEKTTYIAEIKEELAIGSSVIQVRASVIDGSTTTYRLDALVKLFAINLATGWISVAGRLDREVSDNQRFYAFAKNVANGLESQVEVVVHLSDVNDNAPQIENLPTTISLRENAEPGFTFFTVVAKDKDASRNALLSYSITHGNQENRFKMDSYSGKISTVSRLDFESTKDYNISITVEDNGQNITLSNSSVLRIFVQDHDDQPAKFQRAKYFATIPENSAKGHLVTVVKAVDLDTAINAPVEYSIHQESNLGFAFSIDKSSGAIKVNNSLDRENIATYKLQVKASSTIFNPDYATVEITVADTNDNRPKFSKDRYDASVVESAKIGTTVLRVSAEDKDAGTNAEFSYAIVGGDAIFGVSSAGDIYVDGLLDREKTTLHQFVVVAFETKTTEKYDSSTRIYISVEDANDNPPEFQQNVYLSHVIENVPVGASVMQITAADKDSGRNAEVVYSLLGSAGLNLPFKIDSQTGLITTIAEIDREQASSYNMTVFASNYRANTILSSNATLVILIDDVNDNLPIFPLSQYSFQVSENNPADHIINQFTASDADNGINGTVTYGIVSGDASKFFIGNQSGVLKAKVSLDREEQAVYNLIIEARDGSGKNSTSSVTVEVLDVNDNIPQFSSSRGYGFFIIEGEVDAFVGQIKASDKDAAKNANVTYMLTEGGEHFSIDSITGIIRNKVAFDYESRISYTAVAKATDNGSPALQSSVNIKVTVLDVNDNKPTFERRLYLFNVTENSPAAVIGIVNASDRDSGLNAFLRYRIVSGNKNDDFSLNSSSGFLSTRKSLDREVAELHILIVSVTDTENQQSIREDLAAIQIKDQNDNSPIFEKSSISITIGEDTPAGSVVASFRATDKDVGRNQLIRYKITQGNTNNRFSIDVNSGAVFVLSNIDRDPPNNEHSFTLFISASDMGIPPRSALAKLHVSVKDANDNKPTFHPDAIEVSLEENKPLGTKVVTLNCTDKDSESNGRISFRLVKGSNMGFSVDPLTGSITTTKTFDYDTGVRSYPLEIEASDFGATQLKSSSKVLVKIMNVNDNSPQFTATGPFSLNEGNYTGRKFRVGKIEAYDSDLDTASSVYGLTSYQFVNMSSYYFNYLWLFDALSTENSVNDVKMNLTAVLHGARLFTEAGMGNVVKLSGSPNYIVAGDFKGDCISNPTLCTSGLSLAMWIKFEAGGYILSSGAQSNHATGLSLNFESGFFRLRLATQTKEFELRINSVSANWYHFAFTWDENSGLAYYENGALLTKAYTVADVSRVADAYTKLIIGRPNDADAYPQLFGRFYVGELVIWKLKLADYEVMHAFTNSGPFEIDSRTGEIFATGVLDREATASFSLDVKVTDGDPANQKHNHTQIDILVVDVNDNAPTFGQDTITIQIQENLKINTEIFAFAARDEDAGNNGLLSYSIAFGNTANTFAVNAKSGKLTNVGKIDREMVSHFTLQVVAEDGGTPPRRSTAFLNIRVMDANDEFPQFSQQQYLASIKENLPADQFVTQVFATDKDLGVNGTIRYNMSSEFFSIDTTNGKITTKLSLDRENVSKHTLIVTAFDGGSPAKNSAVPVIIDVEDENDNAPAFEKPNYYALITENRKVGSSLIQVVAKDSDSGLNGAIRYSMTDGQGIFAMNPNTGLVLTADIVDRERFPNGFNIIITCSDQGTKPLAASVNLFVNISDANDNSPVFSRYSYRGKVIENAIGAVAVAVNATDADTGPAGEILYTITGGNSEGAFVIDVDGRIKTAKRLDRESKAVYELVVRAKDRGGEPKHADVEVDIEVLDANDNAPRIGDLPNNILISEATLVGSQVVTVTATDLDIGTNSFFSFNGISVGSQFTIDGRSGAVLTAASFDYELMSRYTFIVWATDNGNPSLNSTKVSINFTIVDSNDNNPVFNPAVYFASVKENSVSGTRVVTVNASESDTGSTVIYYIANGNLGNAFQIDSRAGVISVHGNLDRETTSIYYLLITASDNGMPPRLGQAYVTVTITDENDLPPKFQFLNYGGEVKENMPIGTNVVTLTATDPDLSNKTKLQFQLVDGNVENAFSISTYKIANEFRAVITTAGKIDRETTSLYRLMVKVSDGFFSDFVNVTIKVIDENDNFPVFNSSIYQATAFENEEAGKFVLKISAVDLDEGQNAMLRYGIENSNGMLFIDRFSGEITTTTKTMDREAASIYDILCSAQDSGGKKGFTIVRITILDKNDMKPVFSPLKYDFEVQEGLGSSGKIVAAVKATDADDGSNAKLLYRIKSGNFGNAFHIHPETGVVTSIKELDREQDGLKLDAKSRGVYELAIEAVDQGDPSLVSTTRAQVNVYLLDVNDNQPVFPANGFSVFISEGALANQDIVKATAVDVDAWNNSEIHYEIITGNEEGDFKMNSKNAMLMTARKLERQKTFAYNLTIKASDLGSPSLASQTQLRITIGDTNDNAPVFKKKNYSVQVSENISVSSVVVNISATDADTGQNAIIRYEIVGGNEDGSFAVSNKDGFASLIVTSRVDREKKASYHLSVMAIDGGIPYSRMAIAYVTIGLLDENDNSPVFTHTKYTGSINEGAAGNIPVAMPIRIQAADADVGLNAEISYTLEGPDSSAFTIDASGVLKTTQTSSHLIDYEKKTNYDFAVVATDRLGSGLKAVANVTVLVTDVNDNYPMFLTTRYFASIKESVAIGQSVIQPNATDPDSGYFGFISYRIISGSDGKFTIDPTTGMIRTQDGLDRERKEIYILNVSAYDAGLPPNVAYCSVFINITDVNDNTPIFDKMDYAVNFVETDALGAYVTKVRATDPDYGEAGKVTYSINSAGFLIDSQTGVVRSRKALDREIQDRYDIIVSAVDGGGRTSNASLSITVLDINDNVPQFLVSSPLIIDVFEKTPNNSILAILEARDKDVGRNGKVEYTINGSDFDIFSIDREKGILRLSKNLDVAKLTSNGLLSNGTSLSLNIIAMDYGEIRRSSLLALRINIIDINEENPYFNATLYNAFVMENIPVGSSVLKVEARKSSLSKSLSYGFVGQPLAYFDINQKTGEITTVNEIDREKNSKFILNVKVNDNELPPRFGYTTVVITALDSNDNAPAFDLPVYRAQASEGSNVGDIFYTVKASDADAGKNSLITYRLKHADIGRNGSMVRLDSICVNALGLESQKITASQMTSSTTLIEENKDFSPTQGRFNSVQYLKSGIHYQGAWCAGLSDTWQFLQIDLGTVTIVTKVGLQGSPGKNNYVTSFSLLHSNDAESWKNTSKVYPGAENNLDTVIRDIIPEIRARYIRINPLSWKNRICLRAELYGCESDDALIVRVPFEVHPRSGAIAVTEQMNREVKGKYRVVLEAIDNGAVPLNTSTLLEVMVLDANDNAPAFASNFYHAVVPENSLPGYEVATVVATDADAGRNAEISYRLINGFSRFIIETSSGIVRVSGHVDYENPLERQFTIEIVAEDSGIPSLRSKAILLVNITDVNDNPPVFNSSLVEVTIFEGMSIGIAFAVVVATDRDVEENSQIKYKVLEGTDYFSVNVSTGALRCLREIDREKDASFIIKLEARDSGKPSLHSTVKVSVIVLDINDNPPTFAQRNYVRVLSEATNIGSVVAVVTATDPDAGHNARISYSTISTNYTGAFQMDPRSGEISLTQKLDRELLSMIQFQVLAQDNGNPRFNDTANVTFFISDENDNSPIIYPDTLTVDIREDVPKMTFVVKVNATDRDQDANAEFQFSLVHGAQDLFSIDPKSGIITTSGQLDREQSDHYSVVVMASDKGKVPMHGFATVRINLLDVNDNSPAFMQVSSPLTIFENVPSGTIIGRIRAIDKDIGENAYIEYFLAGESGDKFAIDRKNGLITSLVQFDREQREYYNLSVNASNTQAKIIKSTFKMFFLRVLDTNDNAPVLLPSSKTGIVSEDAPIGTEILQLRGIDLDLGLNAKLAFNILYAKSDQTADFLAINSQTGVISTRLSILNRETRNVTVYIEVSDFGEPHRLNSTERLVVQIRDVNDHLPEFTKSIMRASITEGKENGTFVTRVEAFDKDEGSNTDNVYMILSGNEKGHFKMDTATGVIKSNHSLDREHLSSYVLNISVANVIQIYNSKGLSQNYNTATLVINVTDVNDNAPYFTRSVFTGGVPSGAKIGTFIMEVKAKDNDSGKHAKVVYSFVNGNQDQNFRIDVRTGKIFSMTSLVRKSGQRFQLSVSASDNDGTPPFNSVSNLTTARSKVYIESVLDVKTPDGTPRSEIVFHAVDERLGIIHEADFVIKKIEANLQYYQDQSRQWKIRNVSPATSQQIRQESIETHVVVIIVVGVVIGLLLLFALAMFIRMRRMSILSRVSADDPLSQYSKESRKRRKRAKHFRANLIAEQAKEALQTTNTSKEKLAYQTSAQDNLDDLFIELRSDLEKLKSLGVDEYPEEVSPEEFASFDDTVAATEPMLSDESILAMVGEVEEPIKVEDDDEDGDDSNEDQCLEKPTST
eukprot:gene2535-730_t